MLRILLLFVLLVPQLALADTSSSGVHVAVTIIRQALPQQRLSTSTYTQGAAEITVIRAGFRNIQPLGKAGVNYYFSGVRQGRLYEIAVAVSSGRIMRVTAV